MKNQKEKTNKVEEDNEMEELSDSDAEKEVKKEEIKEKETKSIKMEEEDEEEEENPVKSKDTKKNKSNKTINDVLKDKGDEDDNEFIDEEEKKYSWKKDEPVPYLSLAHAFEKMEKTTKRLQIQQYLCNYFYNVINKTPSDLLASVYLCCNQVAPAFEGIELGIGDSSIIKAISEATGSTKEVIEAKSKDTGDLGIVAENSKTTQKMIFPPKPLTVSKVFTDFKNIASSSGDKSNDKKTGYIKQLLVASRECESRYIVRALQGKLRIGLALQSVLISLGDAVYKKYRTKSKEECEEIIKQAYNQMPSFDIIIPKLIESGIDNLLKICCLTPGIPIKPMLAKPTKGISEVLDRFNGIKFTCEYKYDGERAQIHKTENGEYKIFSRNSENQTGKYPDLIEFLKSNISPDIKSFVIDSEVVAWDRVKKQLLPFQILSTRARKDVSTENITVQVIIMAFDLLYFNGESLLEESFDKRRKMLHEHFHPVEGKLMFATHKEVY